MSSPLAIAAVTLTLHNLLREVGVVSMQPPDTAAEGGAHLNLFLYQVDPNASWRNQHTPLHGEGGARHRPPLALNLYYLLSAYGHDNKEDSAHQLLGQAMAVLFAHPVLDRQLISDSTTDLKDNGLDRQFEAVRLTHQPVSTDEMSKLWSMFQKEYRLSVVYEASVVLIEPESPPVSPLPVLSRGPEDRGPFVVTMPPMLTEIEFAQRRGVAYVGETIVIRGINLAREGLTVRIQPVRGGGELVFTAAGRRRFDLRSSDEIELELVRDAGNDANGEEFKWRAGFYNVLVTVAVPGGRTKPPLQTTSNTMVFGIAPSITDNVVVSPARDRTFEITVDPEVVEKQVAEVVFRDKVVMAEKWKGTAKILSFPMGELAKTPAGKTEIVRLRIDGIECVPVDRAASILRWDPKLLVEIK